ncbi:MAG: flagellar hook-length control protein FliK, partial [Ketobacter sp.]|nr:flagellar hook-length control protein FliK [Ketobacter sp.]
ITLANGTLTAVSSADGGVTWTGTFTPTDDIEDTTNVISVGTALNDLAGNAPLSGGSSANYTIDTKEPVVSSVVMSDSALKVGETSTLTITFSEAVTNFDNSDITLENGTITAVSSADGGVTWTGTFTPTDDIEDTTNVISVGTALTDLAGNAPLAGNSTGNYTIDTKEPVVSSVVMSDSALLAGETSTLTI